MSIFAAFTVYSQTLQGPGYKQQGRDFFEGNGENEMFSYLIFS